MARSWVVISANAIRRTVAAMTPISDGLAALLHRKAGGRKADDDRIVARQDEVDHHNGEEGFSRLASSGSPCAPTRSTAVPGRSVHLPDLGNVFKWNRRPHADD